MSNGSVLEFCNIDSEKLVYKMSLHSRKNLLPNAIFTSKVQLLKRKMRRGRYLE